MLKNIFYSFLLISFLFFQSAYSQHLNSEIINEIETDAITKVYINNNTSSEHFGFALATGDFNGDGYPDFVSGAPNSSAISPNRGRVYIYFGGLNYDFVPDLIFNGEASNDLFGYTLKNVGDVNGDGFIDLLIGAYLSDSGGANSGRAYLYFGGVSMDNIPDVIFTGEVAGDQFSYSLSSAGDVNGDGYNDILISSPQNDQTFTNAGKVYLYYGGSTVNNVPDKVFLGENADDQFGISVCIIGDYNGDGFDDLIIGAPNNDDAGNNAGAAFVYYGGSDMNTISDQIIYSGNDDDRLGSAVSDAGDFNGDGYSDFVVGIPRADNAGFNSGLVLLYLGGANPSVYFATSFSGVQSSEYFGLIISNAGDFNCDGFSDIIIGSPSNYSIGSNVGRINIYFGSSVVNNTADFISYGESFSEYLGLGITSSADFNGDGNVELIAGAYGYSGMDGRVYLFKQKMTGNDIPDEYFLGNSTLELFGADVSLEGDLNGDGFNDVVISSPGYLSNRGRVSIFYGGALLDNDPDVVIYGENEGDHFGNSISTNGDINGDGFDDLLVGARMFNGARGKAYIYLGANVMDSTADRTYLGENIGEEFGYKVAMGIVGTDNFTDYLISSPKRSSAQGRVYYYFGSSTPISFPNLTFIGESANSNFGVSCDIVGDVNGDGYGDFLIGAHNFDSSKGKAYLYYGIPNGSINSNLNLIGEAKDNFYGFSVSKAGDINKDGYKDFIIGAPGFNSLKGKAYVYYGGLNMTSDYVISISGTSVGENLGYCVNGGGDINADGYSDFAVGSPYHTSNRGRANFFFGSALLDNIADLTVSGRNSNDQFGQSFSISGDVNGDAKSDFLLSRIGYNSGIGLSQLHLSNSTPVNPRITNISDVPNDQGGFIKIKFTKSGFDEFDVNSISHYEIERSDPPGNFGFAWQTVSTQNANNNIYYNLYINTPSDSNSNGNSTFFYRVTARTSTNGVYWRSNILSGRSIDNLAPLAPADLMAEGNFNSINLSWNPNNEPDLKKYLIYKNGEFFKESLTISFVDTNVVQDSVYIYQVAAQDINGNISELSNPDSATLEAITLFDVTVIPEGLLNISTNTLRIRDTITAYLYDLTGSDIIDSAKGVLDSVTFKVDLEFKNANSGTYYLVIKHRNCIETWSKIGGEEINRGGVYNYDFTNSAGSAYGDNLKLKGGKYCLYSGDVNSSGVINSTDRTLIRNNVGQVGYIRFDLDGNGVVNSSDRTIVRNNTGISKQRP